MKFYKGSEVGKLLQGEIMSRENRKGEEFRVDRVSACSGKQREMGWNTSVSGFIHHAEESQENSCDGSCVLAC